MTMPYRVFMFLFCLSLPVLAQQGTISNEASAQAEAMGTPSHESHITLNVVVTDKAGKPIAGLQQQDFTVFDNKKPQPIVSFKAMQQDATTVDPPAQVILLIDAVNASYQHVAYERDQIKRYLLQNDGKLAQPVSLVFFSDKGTVIQDKSTTDGKALLAAFDENQSGLRSNHRSQGFYGAADTYELSLSTLSALAERESHEPGRKLLIWVSPGWPLLSGPSVELSQQQERSVFRSIVMLSDALRRANITLYSVDPLGTGDSFGGRELYYEVFLKGATSEKGVQSGNLALEVLATQSGGQVLKFSNDIAGLIARAASDANAYYVVSIEVPPAEHPDEYHAIAVKVDKPGLTARTRTGYYAQP